MIRSLVRKKPGPESKVLVQSYLSLWNNLLKEDERMRDLLKRYPTAPYLKLWMPFEIKRYKGGMIP